MLTTTDITRTGEISKILFVRHGHAVANANGMIAGEHRCAGLTYIGRRQAAALADRLAEEQGWRRITTVYATRTARTRQTAAAVCDLLGTRLGPELPPPNYGAADGMEWSALRAGKLSHVADPDAPLAEDAEPWHALADRAQREAHQLAHRHQGESIVVVTHRAVVSSLAQALMHAPPSRKHATWELGHTGITEWHYEPWPASGRPDRWRWRLVRANDTTHLSVHRL